MEKGLAFCVDPADWTLTQFSNFHFTSGTREYVRFGFELCKTDEGNSENCLSDAQLHEWFEVNQL